MMMVFPHHLWLGDAERSVSVFHSKFKLTHKTRYSILATRLLDTHNSQ